MKIEEALCFDDVLLVPKYSHVETRKDVDLSCCLDEKLNINLRFPIIASPMDTISQSRMADAMYNSGGLAVVHRYNTVDEQIKIVEKIKNSGCNIIAVAIGVTNNYLERIKKLYNAGAIIFCIDVSHGHNILVEKAIKSIKDLNINIHLIAGSVATADGFKDLEEWGADSIRVGIGGGCFLPNNKVTTDVGLKNIQDVCEGDAVKTHSGVYKRVAKTFKFKRKENILNINNKIKCTKEHKFYVLNKKYKEIINENNIHKYAEWVEAKHLEKDKYFLLELK
jgi:IMP dehydrogenase/GMP reductase